MTLLTPTEVGYRTAWEAFEGGETWRSCGRSGKTASVASRPSGFPRFGKGSGVTDVADREGQLRARAGACLRLRAEGCAVALRDLTARGSCS